MTALLFPEPPVPFPHGLASSEKRGECESAWYPDAPVQWRLLVVLMTSLAGIFLSFVLEDELLPWRSRMDTATPGWAFVLAQAAAFGFVAALSIRARATAVAAALLAATLFGYAYVLAGSVLIDGRRAVQYAHLIFRAVELGLVTVAAMMLGSGVRWLSCQRLTIGEQEHPRVAHFRVADLMGVTLVFAVGLWLVNIFFDYGDRESQLADLLLAILRALPAALPWLWGLTQSRLSPTAVLAIVGSSLVIWAIKSALEYRFSGEDIGVVMLGMALRAAAYAVGASLSGLLLRTLGFRWSAA